MFVIGPDLLVQDISWTWCELCDFPVVVYALPKSSEFFFFKKNYWLLYHTNSSVT